MLINLPHKISHTLFNLINKGYIKNNYRIDNILSLEINSKEILKTKFIPLKTNVIGFSNICLNTLQSYYKNNKIFNNNVMDLLRKTIFIFISFFFIRCVISLIFIYLC